MAKERLVIMGGNGAGMSAASQARRLRSDLEIIAFEKGPHVSYASCGLPYLVGGTIDDTSRLLRRTPEIFKADYGIDVRTLHEVVEIDIKQRQLGIRLLDTGEEALESYDQLVVATGTMPIRPPVPGIDSPGVHGVSTITDGIAIREALDLSKVKRVVIVGGGYIGVEMAEALIDRRLEVSLIDMLPQVMGTLDEDMGGLVSEAMRKAGIRLYLEEKLEEFEINGGHVKAVVTDKHTIPTDMAILAIGVRPNTRVAKDAGIPVGVKNAIRVNDRMRTEVDGVWAVGDCAETFHLVSKKPFFVALGTVANKTGRIAGTNIGGGSAKFPGALGTAITRFRDVEVGRTGLQEREAKGLGLDYVTSRIESHVRAGYYPDPGRMTVKMVAEKGSGRLLGGQIVGTAGAARRIDVIAVALQSSLTLADLVNLDLGYAPPFSSVWDPIHIAARQALGRI
jgi:NADPH-dependent 2,4-dienoyl-CoA reductase/sulfur reductase-like enzyme